MANSSYVDLINRVIGQFDDIYDALQEKGVKYNGTALADGVYTGIATSEYAGLIRANLIGISGKTNLGNTPLNNFSTNSADTAVAANTEVTLSAGTGSTYKVVAQGLTEGYYNTNSYIYTTIDVENITFSPTGANTSTIKDSTDTSKVTGYLVSPAANKLISSVSITKGSVAVSIDSTNASQFNLSAEYEAVDTLVEGQSILVSDKAADFGGKAVSFQYTTAINRTGSVTVAPNVAKTAGYITESDVTSSGATVDLAATISGGTKTLYIKQGSLTNIQLPSTTTASVTGSGVTWLTPGAEGVTANDYIELSASIADGNSNSLTVTGTLEEGYISGNADGTINLGSVSISAGKNYLKKGKINNITGTAGAVTLKLTDNDGILAAQTATTGKDQYVLSLGVGTDGIGQTLSGTAVDGYISATSYSATVSGTTDIYIDKGSVVINPTATIAAPSGDTNILTTSGAAKKYSITLTPSIDLTALNPTEGYITSDDVTTGTKTETPTTIYIAHGDAVVNAGLSIDLVEGEAADGEHAGYENQTVIDIFDSEAPTDKDGKTLDHYKILATASKGTINAGYMSSSDITANNSAPKYLRKADVVWHEEKDTDGIVTSAYLEVVTGGYLPSGIISTIDTDSAPNFATIQLAPTTGSSAIFKLAAGSTDDYILDITKTSKTSAGYISGSEGQGTVNGTFYVTQGSASLENGISYGSIAAPAPVLSGKEGDENRTVTGYTLSVPVIATATLGLTEGYVESKNVTLNGEAYSAEDNKTVVINETKTIELTKAILAPKTGTQAISLSVTPTGVLTTGIDPETNKPIVSSYAVTPEIAGDSTITIKPTTAGYLSTTDETVINVLSTTQGEVKTIYIKPGEGGKIGEKADSTNTVAFDINFNPTDDKGEPVEVTKYTGTISGAITAEVTLDEGYYGAEEKVISNNIPISGASFDIAKGSFAIENTVVPDVTAPNGVFTTMSSGDDPNEFVAITTNTVVTSAKTTEVAGYTKTADVTVGNKEYTETTKYIKKVTNYTVAQAAGPATIDESVVAAAQSISVPVANKFSTQDITVTLHADAMGTAVAAKLRDLESRLAGTYAGNNA